MRRRSEIRSARAGRVTAVNATGCLEVFSTPYPETSWQIPRLHSLFGNAPAVATVADLRDLEYKAERAMEFRGARYLQVLVPYPLGWRTASNETIRVARLATETGIFPVRMSSHGSRGRQTATSGPSVWSTQLRQFVEGELDVGGKQRRTAPGRDHA